MKRILFILIFIAALLSIILSGYASEEKKLVWEESWPKEIRIGSGTLGGGAYMGAGAIANVLKTEFPELEIINEQTKSSVQNIMLLENDEIHIGACSLDCDYDALTGAQGSDFEGTKHTGFRALMPRGPAPIMYVTLEKNNITNVKQFTGRFSTGSYGTALSVFGPKAFEVFGNKVEIVNLPHTDAVQALRNGSITGLIIGHPNTVIVELAMQADIRIIGITGEDAEVFLKAHPEYNYPLIVPAGYYKGQDEALEIAGLQLTFNVQDDLPEEMVYTILKAWHKHQDIVKDTWPELLESVGTNPEYMIGISKVSPVHKGAIKYYKELGLDLGDAPAY